MADRGHLAILKQGVEAWNAWRKANQDALPSLIGADLRRAVLSKASLREVDLSEALLNGADLREADLSGADLGGANLTGADLGKADLRGTTMRHATLEKVQFRDAILDNSTRIADKWRLVWEIVTQGASYRDLGEADLREAYLCEADLREANLRGADLSGAELRGAALTGAHLREANLYKTSLTGADLSKADLGRANLNEADLGEARLTEATFDGANLRGTRLGRAKLGGAHFYGADLRGADLTGADLTGARLSFTILSRAALSGADLSGARLLRTAFNDVDLSQVRGLDKVRHDGPSTIGIDTLYRSRGKIPEAFLRGCGVSERFTAYVQSSAGRASEYCSCFISYSAKDEECAKQLYTDLQANNVRCWLAPGDIDYGARIRAMMDDAGWMHEKVVLLLSEASSESRWVAQQVERALQKEREMPGSTILVSIRLDAAVMTLDRSWLNLIRNTRNIGDFSRWKEYDAYRQAFAGLLHALKA